VSLSSSGRHALKEKEELFSKADFIPRSRPEELSKNNSAPRRARSTSSSPNARSNSAMCLEIAGWLMRSSAAAAELIAHLGANAVPGLLVRKREDHACIHLLGLRYAISAK
jgi:hypothetical protein